MADSAPQFSIQEIDQRLGIHPLEILAVDGEIRAGFALADAAAPGEGAVDRMLLEIFFDDFQIPLVAPGETGAAHADDDGVLHSFSSSRSAPFSSSSFSRSPSLTERMARSPPRFTL